MTTQTFKRYSIQDALRDAAQWLDEHDEFDCKTGSLTYAAGELPTLVLNGYQREDDNE